VDRRNYLRRALLLLLALAFLFETWIWDRVVAAAQRLSTLINWAAIRAALRRVIDRLPVWVALMLFGVPFIVAELGRDYLSGLVKLENQLLILLEIDKIFGEEEIQAIGLVPGK